MLLLTTVITPLAIYASFNAIQHQVKQYYIFMLLLEVGMTGVFLAQDLFLFYIFWEFTLIPMYFLIGIWGGQQRVYASIKFFLYTMAGSLFMLLAILYMGITNDTFSVPDLIAGRAAFAGAQNLLFIGFALAFAVKVPLFPFHSWLPDAHTEAPTAGSIILAGILLKMGTYGFIRFNLPLFPEASIQYAPFIAVLAIIGIIYGAIVSFAQKDVKKAGCLLQRQPSRLCHAGHLLPERCGLAGRYFARRQPRHQQRRSIFPGGHHLRAAPHPPDRRVWWFVAYHACVQRSLAHRRPL